MEVNYLGSVYPTRAVITTMKERRMGRIMFVSSQAGQLGLFGYTAYSPSKFALRGLAESLQMEVSSIPFSPNMVSNFRAFVWTHSMGQHVHLMNIYYSANKQTWHIFF